MERHATRILPIAILAAACWMWLAENPSLAQTLPKPPSTQDPAQSARDWRARYDEDMDHARYFAGHGDSVQSDAMKLNALDDMRHAEWYASLTAHRAAVTPAAFVATVTVRPTHRSHHRHRRR